VMFALRAVCLAARASPPRRSSDLLQSGLHLGLLLLVTYITCCFGIFLFASVAYRFRRLRTGAAAIIVLGAGLINVKVPPLLTDRLERGIMAHRRDAAHPVIIHSGVQGADEP